MPTPPESNPAPPKMMLIEWEDAYGGDHSWVPAENVAPEPWFCLTIGFVVFENRERITVAQSRTVREGEGAKVTDLMTIPSGMIRKMTPLYTHRDDPPGIVSIELPGAADHEPRGHRQALA